MKLWTCWDSSFSYRFEYFTMHKRHMQKPHTDSPYAVQYKQKESRQHQVITANWPASPKQYHARHHCPETQTHTELQTIWHMPFTYSKSFNSSRLAEVTMKTWNYRSNKKLLNSSWISLITAIIPWYMDSYWLIQLQGLTEGDIVEEMNHNTI